MTKFILILQIVVFRKTNRPRTMRRLGGDRNIFSFYTGGHDRCTSGKMPFPAAQKHKMNGHCEGGVYADCGNLPLML